MDVYRAINADVPQVLFTVLHQASPTISDEDYTRTITTFHQDVRRQAQAIENELRQWLQQQYTQQAENMLFKLQRLGIFAENADLGQVQEALVRDYGRLGNRIGSETLLGLEGSGEVVYDQVTPSDPDLGMRVANGRSYLASLLGFKPGQGAMHESWLLFRGSMHYDIIEHVMRNRMNIGDHPEYIGPTTFGSYNLIYQIGESLTYNIADISATQGVTFAFSKGSSQYRPFRLEVAALMEEVAAHIELSHASFWQGKLGLGLGKEFMLRLRLPAGEKALQEIVNAIANAGQVGKEAIVEHGKMLLGKRVL